MTDDQLIRLSDWTEMDNLAQEFVLDLLRVMLAKNGIRGCSRTADTVGAMNENNILLVQFPGKGQNLPHHLSAGRHGRVAQETFLLIDVVTYGEMLTASREFPVVQ